MRPIILLGLLLVAGCSAEVGPMRRRPGANMVLPQHISVKEVVLKEAMCLASQKRDTTGSAPRANDALTKLCGTIGPVAPPQLPGSPPPPTY